METFVCIGIQSLNKRFKEVELIIEEAKRNTELNENLYNALCRSAQVLISAHFEGYLKELIRNSLEDINHFSSFKKSNKTLKIKFCEYFILTNNEEKKSKSNYNKINELIGIFESLDAKFKKEYFIGPNNKNPKATVLDKIAEQFGIKNFFNTIKNSNLDVIFSNTYTENIELRDKLRDYIIENTKSYPYSISLEFLDLNETTIETDNLWGAFLSDLLKRRHDIAHGTEIENGVGYKQIESDKIKIEVLSYAFTLFICTKCNPELHKTDV